MPDAQSLPNICGMGTGMPPLGSATRATTIMDLRDSMGRPRFYLFDEHPATYRLREHRKKILDLLDITDPQSEGYRTGHEVLAYIQTQLDAFNAGELEAMEHAWDRFHRWREDAR